MLVLEKVRSGCRVPIGLLLKHMFVEDGLPVQVPRAVFAISLAHVVVLGHTPCLSYLVSPYLLFGHTSTTPSILSF